MSIFKIVIKNIRQRSLSSFLTAFSIMLGIALVISILILRKESETAFNQTATGYELIVGPKGSSLQLTLSTIYHIGFPIQNIPLSYYEMLKNDKRVKIAIPYVLGDNYKNKRIIGTVPEIFTDFDYQKGKKYTLSSGKYFTEDLEAVIGSSTAEETGLKVGDTFIASHGVESFEGSPQHEEEKYTVTGILNKTYTPTDRVIFVSMASTWELHHSKNEINPADTSKEKDERTITAILVSLKNPVYFDLLRRQINENKFEGMNAQAVFPLFEIKQLFDIIGNINSLLLIIAYMVIIVAAISILVSLYNTMNDRKRDIAIMRALGAKKSLILFSIMLEGLFITVTGALMGWIFSHLIIFIFRKNLSDLTGVLITGTTFDNKEILIAAGTILLGIVVSVIPALKAYRTDTASNLAPVC
ncbi:ABC transporter permease [soil metagenome]